MTGATSYFSFGRLGHVRARLVPVTGRRIGKEQRTPVLVGEDRTMMYTYVMFNSFNEVGVPAWLQFFVDAEMMWNVVEDRRRARVIVATKRRLGGHFVQFSSARVER